MTDRLACSDAARLRGDDNSATVARIDGWILVEFPGTWGRDPIRDAAIHPDIKRALLGAMRELPRTRVLFIRRRTEDQSGCRIYVVRSSGDAAYTYVDLPAVEEIVTLPFRQLYEEASLTDPPLILVCTHGQHDSCCGRRGYPLYDALRNRDRLDVWQCSHVGGDRFAANAVVLPWGLYYGPVEPEQAAELARATLSGEIFLPSFRGRSTVPRSAQCAEMHVRRASNLTARDALLLTSREEIDGKIVVQLRDSRETQHIVTLEQYTAAEAAFVTCGSKRLEPIQQFRVIAHETL